MKTIQWLIILIFIGLIGLFWWRERSWEKKEAKWAGFKSDTVLVEGKTTQKTDTLTFIKEGYTLTYIQRDTVFITRVDTIFKYLSSKGIREFQDRQPTFALKGLVPFPEGKISLSYDYFKVPIWKKFTWGFEIAIGNPSYFSADLTYKLDYGVGISYLTNRTWAFKIRRTF